MFAHIIKENLLLKGLLPGLIILMVILLVPLLAGGEAGPQIKRPDQSAGLLVKLPSPGQNRYDKTLSKGRFLVAAKKMADPNFAETVILMIDYKSSGGAMGLIINRPTRFKISEYLSNMKELKSQNDPVFVGGPVDRKKIFVILEADDKKENMIHVFDNVYMSMNSEVFSSTIKAGKKFRVFSGYSGWTAGQLEIEMMRGDWHILPADLENVFSKKTSDIWPELIRLVSARWVKNSHSSKTASLIRQ